MDKKRYVKIELPNNFIKGDCRICPFSYEEYDGYDYFLRCILRYHYTACGLKIFTDKKGNKND